MPLTKQIELIYQRKLMSCPTEPTARALTETKAAILKWVSGGSMTAQRAINMMRAY